MVRGGECLGVEVYSGEDIALDGGDEEWVLTLFLLGI